MTRGLRRFQESGQSHFVTFSCYHRQPNFSTAELFDLFVLCLENTRRQFGLCVYGYVVMPEHVHLLMSEPPQARLADAIHDLKLSFSKRAKSLRNLKMNVNVNVKANVPQVRARSVGANLGPLVRAGSESANLGPFWQTRYHDRNVRDYHEFTVKLRYLHRNPVERGLVAKPEDWKWSSYRHYALRETGVIEIESQWTATDREQKASGGPERIFLRSPG
jgi:putative transposase